MNDELKLLKSYKNVCELHTHRIQQALNHVKSFFPIEEHTLNSLSFEQIAILEILTSRFAKLQDTIGGKIFPLLAQINFPQDNSKSIIDILNQMEKLKIIKSKDVWFELREIRNGISQEYPDNQAFLVNGLNTLYDKIGLLLNLWQVIVESIDQL